MGNLENLEVRAGIWEFRLEALDVRHKMVDLVPVICNLQPTRFTPLEGPLIFL